MSSTFFSMALRRGWVPAVIVCVLVRALWMLFVHPEPIADYAFYFTRAAELAQGLGYRYQGHATAFFPVGTSLILAPSFALFGASLAVAKLMSLLAWALTTLLTFKLAEFLANMQVATLAALVVALFPDFIAFSALVASENFFVPLLLGCIYLLCLAREAPVLPTRRLLLAGMLFGAALLVRSTALILIPLLALHIVWDRRRGLRAGLLLALLFIAGMTLVSAPWVVRNTLALGQPVLTTNGGISLWWGSNPHASGGFPLAVKPPSQDLSTPELELANNRRFTEAAFWYMREHPREWLALAPAKFGYLFTLQSPDLGYALRWRYAGGPWAIEHHPRLGDNRDPQAAEFVERPLSAVESKLIGGYYRVAGGSLGLVLQRGLWTLGALGLALMWLQQPGKRGPIALAMAIPAAWILFHITLGNGQPRYLFSIAPIMVLGVAWLASRAYDFLQASAVRGVRKDS